MLAARLGVNAPIHSMYVQTIDKQAANPTWIAARGGWEGWMRREWWGVEG